MTHRARDTHVLGEARGYPAAPGWREYWSAEYRVGSWSGLDQVPEIAPWVRHVPGSARPRALGRVAGAMPVGLLEHLAAYLSASRTCGLLIARGGSVLFESYGFDRTPEHRFLSFSLAKGVTSLLVGIAASKGLLTLEDRVASHVPALAKGAYGDATVLDLLRMRAGVRFTESYARNDDLTELNRAAVFGNRSMIDVLNSYPPQSAGKVHRYATADTEVLGRVLSSAAGRSIEDITQRWLWQPMGAEASAHWIVARPDGHARCSSFLCATLRDWARLGCLLASDGILDGAEVVPRDYLRDATTMRGKPKDMLAAQRHSEFHYGHHFHILPMKARTFALLGIGGQRLYVQPESSLVMVRTGVEDVAAEETWGPMLSEVWLKVLQSLGGDPAPDGL